MLARKLEEDYELQENYELVEEEKTILRAVPKKTVLSERRTLLNTHLRSRCQLFFVVVSILAMAVTVRSGISASRGYALVAVQQQVTSLEHENERLRIEIAHLKSPERIKAIATQELGMQVPQKVYFAVDKH